MKPVRFLGDSLQCVRDFPVDARQDAGYQLDRVQRVQKKTQRTSQRDIELVKARFREMMKDRK